METRKFMDREKPRPFICRLMRFRLLPTILFYTLATLHPSLVSADGELEALSQLSEARTLEQLDAAILAARRHDVSSQTIAEAKVLFAIKTQDVPLMVSLLPEMDAVALDFDPGDSRAGMASVEQWRGLIAYVRALSAMERKSGEQFREQIQQAFWNCPQQAELFGAAVEKFQLQEKMSQWIIDFASPVLVSGDKETTLGEVLGTKKGMLIVFWAEGIPPSIEVMGSVQKMADLIRGHGIVIAGLNAGGGKAEAAAERVRKEKALTFAWLVEPSARTLSRQLEITTLPRAVLVTQQGRVMFHGHPLDPALWKALRRVSPTITAPER